MLGWVEGGNLRMDYRFADGDPDRLAAYAEELVNRRPDLIFAFSGPAARAVQQRTAAIPIVFVGGGDPATSGLVGNIPRPGGNPRKPGAETTSALHAELHDEHVLGQGEASGKQRAVGRAP
jgi:hypothetical protein